MVEPAAVEEGGRESAVVEPASVVEPLPWEREGRSPPRQTEGANHGGVRERELRTARRGPAFGEREREAWGKAAEERKS